MHIQEIDSKELWEGFLDIIQQKTFLHSWAWGEFQEAMGERIWRLGIYDNEKLVGVMLVVRVNAKRGRFLFIPHGPVFRDQRPTTNDQRLKTLIYYLKKLAGKDNCSFIRVSPIWEDTEESRKVFRELGFRSAPMHVHSELTLVLDISKREEEILQGMRKTTRNLVRRGEREGIKVAKGTLDEFYPMFEETAKRQGFVKFSREYLQKELTAFTTNYKLQATSYESADIFLAKYEEKLLAGALIVFYDDSAYYHHAASVHSKVPAAYTLIWEIIKEAKKRGIKQFNFWGVVPEDDTNHPWWGLSLFKRGFGGKEWHLMHAQDLPLSWKYWISWGVERVRKWRRSY